MIRLKKFRTWLSGENRPEWKNIYSTSGKLQSAGFRQYSTDSAVMYSKEDAIAYIKEQDRLKEDTVGIPDSEKYEFVYYFNHADEVIIFSREYRPPTSYDQYFWVVTPEDGMQLVKLSSELPFTGKEGVAQLRESYPKASSIKSIRKDKIPQRLLNK
jgi:hypothetical protein